MSRYSIKTQDAVSTKKALTKFSEKIPVSNKYLQGTFTIKNFRKYSYDCEVDIDFEGKIYVNYLRKLGWYDSSIMETKNGFKVSKIKVNRFIRRNIIKHITSHCNYFGVEVRHYPCIKKLNWL